MFQTSIFFHFFLSTQLPYLLKALQHNTTQLLNHKIKSTSTLLQSTINLNPQVLNQHPQSTNLIKFSNLKALTIVFD